MRKKLAIILILVAILPLIVYGLAALVRSRATTRQAVAQSHELVARRAAAEIALYIRSSLTLLGALGGHIAMGPSFDLEDRQQVVRSFHLRQQRFRTMDLLPPDGIALHLSPPIMGDDGVPAMTIRLPVVRQRQPVGMIQAKLDLTEMWDEVERIRIGQTGFLLLFNEDGTLLAHGDHQAKPLIFRPTRLVPRPYLAQSTTERASEAVYINEQGNRVRALAVPLPPLNLSPTLEAAGIVLEESGPELLVVVEQHTAELYALETQLGIQLVVMASLLLVMMIGASRVLGSHLFMQPVNTLLSATRQLAAGHLDSRVELPGKDELTRLADGFNLMAEDLAKLHQQVRRQERIATLGQVATGLAHDLKHPIQNLKNAARLMGSMTEDPEALADFQQLVHKNLARLDKFLADLRHVTGKEATQMNPVDVPRLLREVIGSFTTQAHQLGVELAIELKQDLNTEQMTPGDPFWVLGDRASLERVVENLLSNALDATPPGGHVRIGVHGCGQDRIEIRVKDTGQGIASDHLEAIFDPFMSTKQGGLGMGLAVCKRLVEDMGGKLAVESTLGSGTTFSMELNKALHPS